MYFRGTVDFTAPQTAVWHALTTPEIVSQCTPRLHGWKALKSDTQFQLEFTWGSNNSIVIIPLRLVWQTVTPPSLLVWQGQAQMGRTLIPLQGEFQLEALESDHTIVTFLAQVEVANKLLQQMIETTAPRLINGFFSCLKKTAETG